MANNDIRLQKFLAERGVASRRQAATILAEGRVQVNGAVIREAGFRLDPDRDRVAIDGKDLGSAKEKRRTIILYKPRGYICSTSDQDGRTVYEFIRDIRERLVPVGRLDMNSEGLLLMSNDGDLILRLTHPRYEHEKTYEVTVSGRVDDRVLKQLQSRMLIDGYRIQPARVSLLRADRADRVVLQFILKEGRNHQIRRMCEQCGLHIHRLIRTKVGNLTLAGLVPGRWRELTVNI